MNLAHLALVTSYGLTAAACTPGPAPVSQSPRDPSNPSAPEGMPPPSPTPVAMLAANAKVEDTATATTTSSEAGAVIYTCPMHPEVTSPSPGKCPKCGMTLVPKK